ncbi:MAG: pilus assembly protein TadG-related protein [Terriglobia bacterium]
MPSRRTPGRCLNDSGSTLYLVAASMVFILATCGLAVDLVALYTARSEAQRAADAAALAGATVFASSGCTGGASGSSLSCTDVQPIATNQAEAVGNTNLVGGQPPTIANVTFPPDPSSTGQGNPLITVSVQQTIPTFFVKIFGVTSETVSASATAEAFNPSGVTGAPTICEGCLKPIIVPNCDPNHASPSNSACPGEGYFINTDTGYSIANPGVSPAGVIGEEWTLSSMPPGSCGSLNPCSQYYEVDLGGSGYAANITSCSALLATCGDALQTLSPASDASLSWRNLIRQGTPSDCTVTPPSSGQDTIGPNPMNTTPPYVVTGGSSNPNSLLQGKVISSSDSIVTVPLYAGGTLNAGTDKAAIVGFMQLFIEYACHSASGSDNLTGVILNLTGCALSNAGGCAPGSTGTVSGGGASTIPVRLVQIQ